MFALNAMHGHPFDARHTFLVNRFTDIERYANLDETYAEPEPEEYKPKVSEVSPAGMLYGLHSCYRSTCALGLATPKAGISTQPTEGTRWRSTGKGSRRNAKSHLPDP